MTDEELKGLFEGLRQENATAHEDTRRHFDVAANDLRKEIQLVAESVVHTREELTRRTGDQSERIERGLAETQSMIRFSHAELDRRMRTLEETVADLQARVERLETSTH